MANVEVITEAVRAESRKWSHFAARMEPPRRAAADLFLEPSAFFIGNFNTGVHSAAYQRYQSFMVDILAGAVHEFDQLAAALGKIADEYDNADKIVELDLNRIYGKPVLKF
jgi:hypothetical protein